MAPYRWSNRATQEFAEWLIKDVVGAELLVRQLRGTPVPEDTPVTNLAVRLRGIMLKSLPFPMDPRWMAEIDWVEVAAYLMSNVELDEEQ